MTDTSNDDAARAWERTPRHWRAALLAADSGPVVMDWPCADALAYPRGCDDPECSCTRAGHTGEPLVRPMPPRWAGTSYVTTAFGRRVAAFGRGRTPETSTL